MLGVPFGCILAFFCRTVHRAGFAAAQDDNSLKMRVRIRGAN